MAELMEHARHYIELVRGKPDSPARWRCIVDEKERKQALGAEGSRIPEPLSLEASMETLTAAQSDGYGVFIVVNIGGNSDAEITKFSALFLDLDGKPIPTEWHVRPDFLVIRDAGHSHAYWLLTPGCTKEQWLDGMRRLVRHYGGDPSICNPSRVMRVPGFQHLKDPNNPKLVTLRELRSAGLTRADLERPIEELTAGLPELPALVKTKRTGEPVTRKALQDMLAHIDPECGRNEWLAVAGGLMNANVIVSPGGPADETFDGLNMFTAWSRGDFQHG